MGTSVDYVDSVECKSNQLQHIIFYVLFWYIAINIFYVLFFIFYCEIIRIYFIDLKENDLLILYFIWW